MEANGGQLTVSCTAGFCRAVRNEYIATRNGKPQSSTKAFVRTIREIEHHHVVRSGISTAEFPDKLLCDWTKQVLLTSEEATEPCMAEVTAEFHC